MSKRKKEESLTIIFLKEYGWAILIVFIVMAFLAHFGAFDLDKFLSEENKKEFVIKFDLKEENETELLYYDSDWDTYGIYTNYTKQNSSINWTDDFSDQLEYFGANNTLKVEYSLEGIEWYVNNKYCDSPNTTLQDGFGKDIAYCFQIDNTCIYDCMWADKNITSDKINLVYHNIWINPEEAMWWTEIEEIPKN